MKKGTGHRALGARFRAQGKGRFPVLGVLFAVTE